MFWIKSGPVICPYCQTMVSQKLKYMGQTLACKHCQARFEALDSRLIAKFDKLLTYLIVFIIGAVVLTVSIRILFP